MTLKVSFMTGLSCPLLDWLIVLEMLRGTDGNNEADGRFGEEERLASTVPVPLCCGVCISFAGESGAAISFGGSKSISLCGDKTELELGGWEFSVFGWKAWDSGGNEDRIWPDVRKTDDSAGKLWV
jgi:hypothetical protein